METCKNSKRQQKWFEVLGRSLSGSRSGDITKSKSTPLDLLQKHSTPASTGSQGIPPAEAYIVSAFGESGRTFRLPSSNNPLPRGAGTAPRFYHPYIIPRWP